MNEITKPDYSGMSIDAILSQNKGIATSIAQTWRFKASDEQKAFCLPIANYLLGIQASRELEKANRPEDALAVLELHDYPGRTNAFDLNASEAAEIHSQCRSAGLIPLVGNKYCDKKTSRAYRTRLEDTVKEGTR